MHFIHDSVDILKERIHSLRLPALLFNVYDDRSSCSIAFLLFRNQMITVYEFIEGLGSHNFW